MNIVQIDPVKPRCVAKLKSFEEITIAENVQIWTAEISIGIGETADDIKVSAQRAPPTIPTPGLGVLMVGFVLNARF